MSNNMKRQFDVNDDSQVDRFNELYAKACKVLGVSREVMEVSFAQASKVLGVTESSVRRWAYANPPQLELAGIQYKSRGVTLDSVVIRQMTVGKRIR